MVSGKMVFVGTQSPSPNQLAATPIAIETSVCCWLGILPTAAIRDEENHVKKVLACWTKADFVFHLANFAMGTCFEVLRFRVTRPRVLVKLSL